MKHIVFKLVLVLFISAIALLWNGSMPSGEKTFISCADALVGRPATPVSYAGVARRTTVRVATPGVGAPGAGARPRNAGGPVNRVGRR